MNGEKTNGGGYISSYACDPATVDHKFLLAQNAYLANTGRHYDHEVIAYQIRQSFKPGESHQKKRIVAAMRMSTIALRTISSATLLTAFRKNLFTCIIRHWQQNPFWEFSFFYFFLQLLPKL